MAINTTSTSGLSPTMQTFYDKRLLKNMEAVMAYTKFGQKRPIPRNNGKTVNFRKFTPFDLATTPLTEGTTPEGHEMSMTELTATVKQYGDYVTVSDLLQMTAIDPVIVEANRLNAMQAGETIEKVTRDILGAGTNVLYAAGSSRASVGATNVLTSELLRKAVRTLKKKRAQPFIRNGKPYFYCIVNPDTTYDLQADDKWEKKALYQQGERVESGEIGKLYGVVVIEATQGIVFSGAGASNADVAGTIVFGRDAYGTIDIAGSGAVQSYVKPLGSGGTTDPLDQRSTIGWKVPAYTACILQQDWIVRIEHGISA